MAMLKKLVSASLALATVFALCSCDAKDLKIPKKIPEITEITLSAEDVDYLNSKHQDTAAEVQKGLQDETSMINDVYKLVNEYRKSMDKEIVDFDTSLSVIATIRAQEIAKSGKFSHHRPDDKGYFSTLYHEYGFTSGNAGENLAKTYKTPEEAVQAWRESPSHNSCMLNSKWTKTGIGIAKTDDGGYIWVQEFSD